jgi:hypothetical protein
MQRINTLTGKLAETFIEQANPENWSGVGIKPVDMDKDARGARNWDLKNANQIGALLMRSLELVNKHAATGAGVGIEPQQTPAAEPDPEADIKRFEKQAKDLLADIGAKRA